MKIHHLAFSLALLPSDTTTQALESQRPNIVFIYADDLGYGDTSCYGATKINTPNIDRLAHSGLRFTNAHATSATCTPSRYALLTGEYPWRRPGTNVLPGDAKLIISPDHMTVASMLHELRYETAAIGKWHLGLGDRMLDWNKEIKPGPLELGFDKCFLVPATPDRVPCVYVEDHHVFGLDPSDPIAISYNMRVGDEPTGKDHPELLKYPLSHGHDQTIVNGVSRIGYMAEGHAARWIDEDMADVLAGRVINFIEDNRTRPLFLYFATHDIHVLHLANARFAGKIGLGRRGDSALELDWTVGQVLDTLDRLGLAENTLVILTSDNGPVVDDGYRDGSVEHLDGHKPAGPLRGGKYSAFEGGTRVPLIMRWPGHIEPGVSPALFSQIDFMATFTTLTGTRIAPGSAPDSRNALPALLGRDHVGREYVIEHSNTRTVEPFQLSARHGNTSIQTTALARFLVPELTPETIPRPSFMISMGTSAKLGMPRPNFPSRLDKCAPHWRRRLWPGVFTVAPVGGKIRVKSAVPEYSASYCSFGI